MISRDTAKFYNSFEAQDKMPYPAPKMPHNIPDLRKSTKIDIGGIKNLQLTNGKEKKVAKNYKFLRD